MTIKEYRKELEEIEFEYRRKLRELETKCALSNAPGIHPGDILFTQKGVVGRVLSLETERKGKPLPKICYKCENLTKEYKVRKKDPQVYIYQAQINWVKRGDTKETYIFEEPKIS